jgi:hypothetical protein
LTAHKRCLRLGQPPARPFIGVVARYWQALLCNAVVRVAKAADEHRKRADGDLRVVLQLSHEVPAGHHQTLTVFDGADRGGWGMGIESAIVCLEGLSAAIRV